MNVIRIMGGLGNQMFQYALYYKFMHMGIETKVDISYYQNENAHNGYELEEIFEVTSAKASPKECKKMAFYKINKINRMLIRIYRRKAFYSHIYTREAGYDKNILKLRNKYIEGYFQSEKYFEDIKDDIKSIYKFKSNYPQNVEKWLEDIKNTNAVSVHIRRGDYSTTGMRLLCNTNYYKNAIEYLKAKLENPVFYIFSNDVGWCKQNFDGEEFKIVTGNTGKNSFWDMFLMSQCKHNIIADSSFSWWSAWLNAYKDKIIIAPEKWEAGKNKFTNIIPETWKIIQE